jgi:hypothetical protein
MNFLASGSISAAAFETPTTTTIIMNNACPYSLLLNINIDNDAHKHVGHCHSLMHLPDDVMQKIISFLQWGDLLYLRTVSRSTQNLINNKPFLLEKCIGPILSMLPKRCLGINHLKLKTSNKVYKGIKKTRTRKRVAQLEGTKIGGISYTNTDDNTTPRSCYFTYIIPKITTLDIVPEDILPFRLWKKLNAQVKTNSNSSSSMTSMGVPDSEKDELNRHSCKECNHLKFNNPSKYCWHDTPFVPTPSLSKANNSKQYHQTINDTVIDERMLSRLAADLLRFFTKPSLLKKPKQRSKVQHLTNFMSRVMHLKELFTFIKLLLCL